MLFLRKNMRITGLGKVALYQLSYTRMTPGAYNIEKTNMQELRQEPNSTFQTAKQLI